MFRLGEEGADVRRGQMAGIRAEADYTVSVGWLRRGGGGAILYMRRRQFIDGLATAAGNRSNSRRLHQRRFGQMGSSTWFGEGTSWFIIVFYLIDGCGCARSSASGRCHTRVLPPGTLCPTTSAPWLILSSSENCWNHTILVKLLTFVDFCFFPAVLAFGWLL